MSQKIAIASMLLLLGASRATAQSLPLFLSAPAMPVADCGLAASFPLPGSASCFRSGGSVWTDATLGRARPGFSPIAPAGGVVEPGKVALSSQRLRARLTLDVRTETPYGPVRAFVSVRAH